jgi:preprotein translocase subunit Sss1
VSREPTRLRRETKCADVAAGVALGLIFVGAVSFVILLVMLVTGVVVHEAACGAAWR